MEAKRESKYIEFKKSFDISSNGEWLEILKDIVAIANTGGGVILFGIKDNGEVEDGDYSSISSLDPAVLTDKIFKYTSIHFSDFEISDCEKDDKQIVGIRIFPSQTPLVFTKPGTYAVDSKKQKTAFSQGSVYFRHGAKSSPGNSNDLKMFFEKMLRKERKSLLQGVRKIVQAPQGSQVKVLPPEVFETDSPSAMPIRIVDDLTAPAYHKLNPDQTHPHRQKEVIAEVNNSLPDKYQINSYDIQVTRKIHKLDSQEKFSYNPKFGPRQYSTELINWLIKQFKKDNSFFKSTREEYYRITHRKG